MRNRKPLLVALVATATLTAGCAGGSTHPGAAAQVGDDTISMATVDSTAVDYCEASVGNYRANNLAVPMSMVRTWVLQSLVARTIADQMAAEYDVMAGSTYNREVSALRQRAATLEKSAREALIEVEAAGAYVQDIATASAKIELGRNGLEDPTSDELSAKASDMFAHWGDADGVHIDPRFDVVFQDGTFAPAGGDGSLSQPVGRAARDAAVIDDFLAAGAGPEQGDLQGKLVSYARSLPADQRCG